MIKNDLYRYRIFKTRKALLYYYTNIGVKFIINFRMYQKAKYMKPLYLFNLFHLKNKYGLEISRKATIGEGLFLVHPFNITINEHSILGKNINIHKGVTIGQENRGNRKGSPIIGNEVWIGVNVTIVGNIRIGNNVLIAPNSFVNIDVPDDSIVFGNPCVVKHNENSTLNYINNKYGDSYDK